MTETARLSDLVTAIIDGDPWYGSNILTLLETVSARAASAHPVPGTHSIWELVVHMTAWTDEVRARLAGQRAGQPQAGDWPAVTDTSDAAWTRAVTALADAHARLAADVRAVDEGTLDAPVGDTRDPEDGTGLTQYRTLHGLVLHTAYHGGQIALLAKALHGER